jgi:beta-glucanase (GH16 family)
MQASGLKQIGIVFLGALLCGCGASIDSQTPSSSGAAAGKTAKPVLITTPAQNGAVIVSLGSSTPNSTVLYTLDGSTPSASSASTIIYQAPFLVDSKLKVTALATSTAPGLGTSLTATANFAPIIASGMLVWSDEFTNSTGAKAQPDPQIWTYDTGTGGFGNDELENYCEWGSTAAPCDAANANAFVDTAGILHIVARRPSTGVYTSARMKTQSLFSFQYGRVEARMKLPESQGMWPAFWLLGNNIATVNWPACGELDVMEHIDGSNPQNWGYDWVQGSIHGTGLNGGTQYHPAGFSAADWHTYGLIWTKGRIQYYVDTPSNVYATFNASTEAGKWPFDDGPEFLILNLAVGGDWPGLPDATTVFPSEVLVDYVRLYTN